MTLVSANQVLRLLQEDDERQDLLWITAPDSRIPIASAVQQYEDIVLEFHHVGLRYLVVTKVNELWFTQLPKGVTWTQPGGYEQYL